MDHINTYYQSRFPNPDQEISSREIKLWMKSHISPFVSRTIRDFRTRMVNCLQPIPGEEDPKLLQILDKITFDNKESWVTRFKRDHVLKSLNETPKDYASGEAFSEIIHPFFTRLQTFLHQQLAFVQHYEMRDSTIDEMYDEMTQPEETELVDLVELELVALG